MGGVQRGAKPPFGPAGGILGVNVAKPQRGAKPPWGVKGGVAPLITCRRQYGGARRSEVAKPPSDDEATTRAKPDKRIKEEGSRGT